MVDILRVVNEMGNNNNDLSRSFVVTLSLSSFPSWFVISSSAHIERERGSGIEN